jgi:hypothetical protein
VVSISLRQIALDAMGSKRRNVMFWECHRGERRDFVEDKY